MQIQDLRSRIVFLRRRIIENENGSFTESWEETGEAWAKITSLGSREVLGEGWENFQQVPNKYKVSFRFRQGKFERIRGEGLTLASLCSPVWDGRRQWMTCLMYDLGENNE